MGKPLPFELLSNVMWDFFQIFVAFSENLNFKGEDKPWNSMTGTTVRATLNCTGLIEHAGLGASWTQLNKW